MAHEAHRAAQKLFLEMQARIGVANALVQKFAAYKRGDEQAVAEQERYESSFRSLLTELEARGASFAYGRGPIVELRAGAATAGLIAGWASTPDRDMAGHEVLNGAFEQAIRSRGMTGARAIKLLLDHDRTKPAGLITKLEYRSRGLWIEASLDLDIEYVRDRWSIIQKLGAMNFSVGFMLEDYSIKTDRNKIDYLEVSRGDLFEISIVLFPCNEAATLDVIAGRPATSGGTITQQLQRAIDQVRAATRALNL